METELDTPAAGRTDNGPDELLVRTYQAEVSAGQGRTVDVRIVPYGETAVANDGFGGVARGVAYTEQWMPGVFGHQIAAAHRVLVNVEHEAGVRGIVGHGMVLREEQDGFYGSFKLHDTAGGDTARILASEGVLGGVSLEARPVRNIRTAAGVVQRVKANLRAIALCREPAYAGAQVLAVREATTYSEELLPIEIDPKLVEKLTELGFALPDRVKEPPVIRAAAMMADPPALLRQCVGALRAYIAAEPDAADKREAQSVLSTLERLMGKDIKEGEATAA